MIEDISPQQAWEMLGQDQDAVLLDVRSRVEHDFVGHPPGALPVPWQDPPGSTPDSFAADNPSVSAFGC